MSRDEQRQAQQISRQVRQAVLIERTRCAAAADRVCCDLYDSHGITGIARALETAILKPEGEE